MPLAYEDDLYTAMENAAHLIRQYYVNDTGDDHETRLRYSIQGLHAQIGPTKQLSDHLKKLGISVSGIHYLCPGWVPVLLNISKGDEALYMATVEEFGVTNHLAMVEHPSEFIIEIPDSFFSGLSGDLNSVLKNLKPGDIAETVSIINSKTIDPSLYVNWPTYSPDSISIDDILRSCQARLPLVLATSCFLTFHRSTCQRVIIYHHPKLGGVAAVSSESEKDTPELIIYFRIFQRLLYLISLVDGYLQAYDNDYPHFLLDDTTKHEFTKALEAYMGNIQRPKDFLRHRLTLDSYTPITVVRHYGNKGTKASWQIVARLAVQDRDAYMFLHVDGAIVLSRITEFLTGWIQGYMSSREEGVKIVDEEGNEVDKAKDGLRVSIDVYVAPNAGALQARKVNLYSRSSLPVEIGSNMSRWYQFVSSSPTEETTVPAVIYRFSETVGPSIFIGEIAAALSRHYLQCEHCKVGSPLRILNLFSGSLACELTMKRRLDEIFDNSRSPVTFLSIDRNPYPLELPGMPDIRKAVHLVSADVFELSEHMSRSSSPLKKPNDVYASGYDLVIADPPHYLTFDFLWQTITWPKEKHEGGSEPVEKPLYSYLAGDCDLCAFILYFGHKEKEWISLEMHRMLTAGGWPHVWSLLVGDERLVVCFGHRGIKTPHCARELANAVRENLRRYEEGRVDFPVRIYDKFYREIEC